MSDGFQVHLFTYSHDGARWTVEIPARSAEDARARLGKLAWATYDGVLVAKMPVAPNWLVRWLGGLKTSASRLYRQLSFGASR